jgi:tetratricopeptide (TPR) repeat protein
MGVAKRGGRRSSTKASPVTDLLSTAVGHHQAGRLEAAARHYEQVLDASPGHADALHFLGLIAHQQGDHDAALARLDAAIASRGDAAPFHNNRGSILLALGQAEEAAASYGQALTLRPDYVEALSNLGGALVRLGRGEEAATACRRALALDAGHAEAHNNLGTALQEEGDLAAAEASYRRALAARPDHAEAHCNLGTALEAQGRLDNAAASHRAAIAARPGYARAHVELANVLQELGDTAAAEAAYRQALLVDAAFAAAEAGLANLFEKSSRLDEAMAAASAALEHEPGNILATVVAAKCARRDGDPAAGIDRLAAIETESLDPAALAAVNFELGHLYDRLGDADEAYSRFAAANRFNADHWRAQRVDKEAYPRLVASLAETFTEEWVGSWTPAIHDDAAAPIFLVGFPRSGTTLLDQILDSHPLLATLEEKPAIDAVAAEVAAMEGGYPGALATLSADDVGRLRGVYRSAVAAYLGAPLDGATLVDKMPLNSVDAGLIHRLFPDARFLLSLRHPCDVVLSGFMQAFRPNPAMVQFSTLADTAALYAQVMDLWRRYARVLPLAVHAVRYEDLVADLEGEARRVLTFLDLPWDDTVLEYAERARGRTISTPSYHQVTRPIYKTSIGRWTRYRDQLKPLLPLLEPSIQAFGYDVPPGP